MIQLINKEDVQQTTTSGSSATPALEAAACSEAITLDLQEVKDTFSIKDLVSIADHECHSTGSFASPHAN